METRRPRFVQLTARLVLTSMMLLSLASEVIADGSTLDAIRERGKILLGVKTDYPPFAYLGSDQQFTGFDVALWEQFAKDLGVEIEYVPITSKSRIPLLLSGRIDVVSGGTTHTIARDEVVDYSITYFKTGQRLLVRKNTGIETADDLAGKKVAVIQGANSGPNFRKVQPEAELVSFQEYPQAVLALKHGRVDALTTDEVILDQYSDDDLEVVGDLITTEHYGMLMRQDDSQLRDWVNVAIQNAWTDGSYGQLHMKHFGREPTYQIEIWQE